MLTMRAHAVLQYCAKVMRANFDEIEEANFRGSEISAKIRTKLNPAKIRTKLNPANFRKIDETDLHVLEQNILK